MHVWVAHDCHQVVAIHLGWSLLAYPLRSSCGTSSSTSFHLLHSKIISIHGGTSFDENAPSYLKKLAN
ncbi:hypothetical protein Fmac_009098 [Flemingia macrophylla]|uniref:Uncharacterized protein n=1 Tax=Flemingia macrophylla TaxID=520843 RepID=A0ABD1MZB4_9FABA